MKHHNIFTTSEITRAEWFVIFPEEVFNLYIMSFVCLRTADTSNFCAHESKIKIQAIISYNR